MQAIVFNYQPSRLSRESETMALKIAYLLAGDVICAGTTPGEIHIRRILSHRSLSSKISLMANFFKDFDSSMGSFTEVQQLFRQEAKLKHRTKEMIVAYKMLEKKMLINWDIMMDQVEDMGEKYGFSALREMTDKVITSIILSDDPEETNDVCVAVSEIFRRMFPEDQEPVKPENEGKQSLFFLPAEFLSPAYHRPPVFEPAGEAAASPANTYLHHAFTFPYLHSLTAAELQSVRGQLQAAAAPFRNAVNMWAHTCYNTADAVSGLNLFLQSIIPLSATLRYAVDSNETVSLCRSLNTHNPVYEVWMGEIPVWNIWAFYHDMEAFTGKTWQKLQEAKEESDFKGRRWPVMVLKATGNPPQANTGEEIQSIRKFLTIE